MTHDPGAAPTSAGTAVQAAPEAIPLFSPRLAQREMTADLDRALREVSESGDYILGPVVERFEAELAAWLGSGVTTVGVGSGTDAIYLALRALGVGPGDEVVTTSLSFVATTSAVLRTGARPVFVDVDPFDVNIDVTRVADAVTARTRALLPVHLFGAPCRMDVLGDVARSTGIPLVEDVAQALGGSWEGRALGTFGTAAAASFFPTKTLGGMGDGGAVICHDTGIADQIRSLRFHGSSGGDVYGRLGANSRLDALQAAVLRVKLAALTGQLHERREIAALYDEALAGHEAIRPLGRRPEGESAFGLYTVWVDRGRADLRRHLEEHRVASRVYYSEPLHLQPLATELGYRPGSMPEAEAATGALLSLPVFPGMPAAWRHRVAEVVAAWRPPA